MSHSNNKQRTRMDASHSNINQKSLHRRDQVFRLSSMGYSQSKIASVLHISQSLISLDISLLREKGREALSDYLENELPLKYQSSVSKVCYSFETSSREVCCLKELWVIEIYWLYKFLANNT